MDTSWEDGDTLAQWAETPSGEVVDRVNLGALARIRYWARATGRCRARTADCPPRCSDHSAGVVCPRLVGVMPATDWAAL